MIYFKEYYCFRRFHRGSIVFQGDELIFFFWGGGEGGGRGFKTLISLDTYRTYNFSGGPDPFPPLDPHIHSFFYSLKLFS